MAGDWIKIEHSTPQKPEVYDIAAATGLSPDDVLGKLIRVWIWFDLQTLDGTIPVTLSSRSRNARVTLAQRINSLVSHQGFGEAMLSTGWLLQEDAEGIPNFDRHNGKSAKKRALTAQRASRFRNASVTLTQRSRNANVTQPALPREENIYTNNSSELGRSAKPYEINNQSKPATAAHSTERTRIAISEQAEAKAHAVPPPPDIMAMAKTGKPKHDPPD